MHSTRQCDCTRPRRHLAVSTLHLAITAACVAGMVQVAQTPTALGFAGFMLLFFAAPMFAYGALVRVVRALWSHDRVLQDSFR